MTLQVLVIEDDPQVADFLAEVLSGLRCRVTCARTLAEGMALVRAQPCDLVFLDVWLPDGVGLDAVKHIRHSGTRPEVVIMTGRGDPSGAALALELGAWDYVCKPLSVDEMRLIAARVMDYRHSALSLPPSVLNIKDFVSFSPAMADCLRLAARAAATDVPVLIFGETGTGKERVARGIHDHSARASMPFVVVDCTVIPESLVESHLFGHERGTFTGADRRRIGLVQLAHQGTLFLDEVGDLPLSAQAKLLRVVQEKTFRPIGAKEELFSDFRLMAATHRSLEDMVARGRFREDLYYRLAGLTLTVPPLRHRKEDIVPLVQEVLRREARRTGGELKGLSTDFLETVYQFPWPGNVRELMQATLHALAVSGESPTLYAAHLPTSVRSHVAVQRTALKVPTFTPEPKTPEAQAPDPMTGFVQPLVHETFPTYKHYRKRAAQEAARAYLQHLMERSGKRITEACALSGLSRSRLYALMQEVGFGRPDGFIEKDAASEIKQPT